MGSEHRFGYEWEKYYWLSPDYEIQFQKWLGPFGSEIFQNKNVLDAGCGMGRNSFWALKYGAKELTAFDFDRRTIEAAKKNLAPFPNARVEFGSIYDINWRDEFDIVFCIGVIHHLAQPQKAIEKLVDAAKSGGLVLIWVYGYEGNEWLVRFISPFRKYFTSKLPPSFLHIFSYFFAAPLWFFVKLPGKKSPYLKQLSKFRFSHILSIVFDQLLPPIANYYKKGEARELLASLDVRRASHSQLRDIGIIQCNQNSWTVYGYKL